MSGNAKEDALSTLRSAFIAADPSITSASSSPLPPSIATSVAVGIGKQIGELIEGEGKDREASRKEERGRTGECLNAGDFLSEGERTSNPFSRQAAASC